MNLRFEFLNQETITPDVFERFYILLENSLPRVEFRSKENQRKLTKIPVYELLVCYHNKNIVGVIAFWHLEDFAFIEHFIVDETCRNLGIGTKMLEFIKTQLDSTVILEVELPYNEMNKRRIAFYERNGFYYNDFEYFQVPLNKGDEPLPLRIMSLPKSISKEQFENVKKSLRKAVYSS